MNKKVKVEANFNKSVKRFRTKIFAWIVELCKEDSKKDYDKMAHMIREQENSTEDGNGIIQWALDHISDISPSIK